MRSRVFSIVAISILTVVASGSAVGPARPSAPSPAAPRPRPTSGPMPRRPTAGRRGDACPPPARKEIGQMICPDIAAGYITDDDPRLAGWIRQARVFGVGMFVLYGGTPRDVANLLNRLQKEAAIPLLISSDFEGGPGQQVAGASEFPANMGLAAARLRGSGVPPRPDRRGRRAGHGHPPDLHAGRGRRRSPRQPGGERPLLRRRHGPVGRIVRAYVRGYRDGGMLTTAKHFPGRGDVAVIPGVADYLQLDKPAAVYEAEESRAFKAAVDAGVSFIMTEHIAVPSMPAGRCSRRASRKAGHHLDQGEAGVHGAS